MVNWQIVGAVVLPNLGGWAGGYFVKKNFSYYKNLKKPKWTPPSYAFGPVWTSIYSSIGYASYLVYENGGGFEGTAQLPLIAYGTQLALNWAWTPIFFEYKDLKLSFYTLGFLNISAATCGVLFYGINKTAGYIFIPYLLWLGLATALQYRIYKDNQSEIEIKEK